MTRTKTILLAGAAAALLGGAASAATTADSGVASLPSYSGTVKHFTITPRGSIDGVILSDGTDVMFPPYLSTQIAYAVKLGDQVTVHGLKAANEPVVQGVSIADGSRTVTDNGPPPGFGPGHHGAPTQMMVQGKIAQFLYGPHGEKNGVLLDDGTALHMPPPALDRTSVAKLLKPGDQVAAVGAGTSNELGKVVMVQQIGADYTDLLRLAMPHRGPKGPHGWEHHGWRHHGPMMRGHGPRHGGPGAPPPPDNQ
ncbi:MAG: hypothetical protein ACYCZB_04240 [Acidiphilium sp.]